MSTISFSTHPSQPHITQPPMSAVDRIALRIGTALIRRVDASQEQHRIRSERVGDSYRVARRQAEAERERSQQRAAMMFWSQR